MPYENTGISIKHSNNTDIIAYPSGTYRTGCGFWTMAEYSTESKAKKAMEMLRNSYSEHVVERIYCEGMYHTHPYFQFPADRDVEV